MYEKANRWIYGAEAALIGLPALCVAGMVLPALLVGVLKEAFGAPYLRDDWPVYLLFAVWMLAGCLGLAAWIWLSAKYLRGGYPRLRETHAFWWLALVIGIAAALPVLLLLGFAGIGRGLWVLGPGLIVPAAHLILLRLFVAGRGGEAASATSDAGAGQLGSRAATPGSG